MFDADLATLPKCDHCINVSTALISVGESVLTAKFTHATGITIGSEACFPIKLQA